MPERIPQSATLRVPLQAYLASDHVTPATGKTIAVTISKNGAAYGNPSGGATNAVEIASGSYYVDLSTTDAGTLGPLFVKGAEGTIDTIIAIYDVVNAHNAGFDGVPNAAGVDPWAVALPGAYGAGTAGAILGGDTDPWSVALPGSYGAGTAGKIVGDNLNATVGSRSTYAGADTSGTTTLLSRIGGSITISGGKVAATVASGDGADAASIKATIGVAGAGLTAVVLAAAGLDAVVVEAGLNFRQAESIISAALAGLLAGAGTTNITVKGAGVAATRIAATVDLAGNRTAITLTPPA